MPYAPRTVDNAPPEFWSHIAQVQLGCKAHATFKTDIPLYRLSGWARAFAREQAALGARTYPVVIERKGVTTIVRRQEP